MSIVFRIALFVCIAMVMSILFTFPVLAALNKLFVGAALNKVLLATVGMNFIYIALLFVARGIIPSVTRHLYYYMGAVGISTGVSLVFWLVYLITYLAKRTDIMSHPIMQYGFIIVTVFLIAVSVYNFEKPLAVEEFTIESDKVSKEYRFVHFADTQLGTTSVAHLNRVIDLVAAQNPDFVVFTGDLVDDNDYSLEDFAGFSKINVPIYFERGNHEFYHDEPRLMDIVYKINSFKPLINEQADFEEIKITSVDHSQSKTYLVEQLESLPRDKKKFNLLLYHDPKGFTTVLDAGFDLMLAGHTHGGQFWPITMMMDWFYPYSNGYYQEGSTHIYTTDGAGLWGPRMRLGSQNEIAVFTITPSN